MKRYNLLLLLVFIFLFFGCGEAVKDSNSVSRVYHVDIDSDPKGADVYWHILSKNDEVSSSNRFHLGQTPIESTQTLRIPNLNKDNSIDVDIVIEIEKTDCKNCYTRTYYVNTYSLLNSRGISLFANLKTDK